MLSQAIGPLPDSQQSVHTEQPAIREATNTNHVYQGWEEGSSRYEEEATY